MLGEQNNDVTYYALFIACSLLQRTRKFYAVSWP